MDDSTHDAHWRQRMLLYCENHGLTATSLRYRVSRKTVWKWRCRWDGSWQSLLEYSRKPHHSPRSQSLSEEKLVKRYGKQYRDDLLLGYQKASTGTVKSCSQLRTPVAMSCCLGVKWYERFLA